jgi:hypothetical protein
MATKSRATLSLADWARTAPAARGGHGCQTCRRLKPDALAQVREVVAMIDKGESQATVAALRDQIQERFDVDLSVDAIRNHVNRCVRRRQ